jgi:hypothetical protein
VPDPETEPYMAMGFALVFILHFPFVNGRTIANVTETVTVPLIPAYALLPPTTGTGAVTTKVPEQVVELNVVGGVLALFSLLSWVVFMRIVPFFNFRSL